MANQADVRKVEIDIEKKSKTPRDKLPQELTDDIAREENLQDREIIMAPLRRVKKAMGFKKGGAAKKYQDGGDVKTSDGRPNYGAKTKIGSRAAQAVYDKNWANMKMPVSEMNEKIIKARDEADDEVQRETTRGIRPKGMKKGGNVSSASKRADGCAIRGKTRA